jgi:type I restriction enzyme S subunit
MSEWKTYRADEFCKIVTDGTHDSPKPQPCGRYLITSKHLKSSGIDFSSANKISEEDYQKIVKRSNVEQYDILFSMIGTVGNIHRVTAADIDYAVKNMGIFKLGGDNVKSLWLYYWLQSPQAKEYIKSRISGSTQGYLTLGSLREFPVSVPPLAEQKRIADILSAIDDKIELNRRINANLEQQAQALYKSWFVDFEPFGGKMPEDWREGRLEDIGEVVGGGTPSKSISDYYTSNGIAWITPKDLSLTHAKFTSKGEIDITELGYVNSSAKLMPRGSILFSSRAPIGYISIAKNDVCTNQGFKSVIPYNGCTAYIYYYLLANTLNIEAQASGSTFKEASGTLMKSLDILIPDDITLAKFEHTMHPFLEQQELIEEQNYDLSNLRDTLLPRLMKGEY